MAGLDSRLRADLKETVKTFEDDPAAAHIQADATRHRACPLPDGSKLDIAAVKVASTGFGDTSFIGVGADTCARSVSVGSPARPLIWSWHAMEVCGGWGGIGCYMAKGGFSVVNIELKLGWNFLDVQVFRWLTHVVNSGRVRFLFRVPPCTTCSLARKPGLRDSRIPWGFDLLCHITKSGTMFGIACLVLALLQTLVWNTFLLERVAR